MNPGRFLEHDFEELIRLYDADGDEAVKISDLWCQLEPKRDYDPCDDDSEQTEDVIKEMIGEILQCDLWTIRCSRDWAGEVVDQDVFHSMKTYELLEQIGHPLDAI